MEEHNKDFARYPRTVVLGGSYKITVVPTGKVFKERDLAPGTLFEFEGEVWEKLPGSNACLSDTDDGSEVVWCAVVRELAVASSEKVTSKSVDSGGKIVYT